jgi:hypothetical protein
MYSSKFTLQSHTQRVNIREETVFGKLFSHKSSNLMKGISGLVKEMYLAGWPLLPCEDVIKGIVFEMSLRTSPHQT